MVKYKLPSISSLRIYRQTAENLSMVIGCILSAAQSLLVPIWNQMASRVLSGALECATYCQKRKYYEVDELFKITH